MRRNPMAASESPSAAPLESSRLQLALMTSKVILPALGVLLVALIGVVACSFMQIADKVGKNPNLGPQDQWLAILLVHLVKVGAGIAVGVICFLLGVVVCWLDLAGAFELDTKGVGTPLHLKGTNAGLLILASGLIVTSIALTRKFELTTGDSTIVSASRQPERSSEPNRSSLEALKMDLAKLRASMRSTDDVKAIDRVLQTIEKQQEIQNAQD